MKRSEINQIMRNTVSFLSQMNFKLPPFAFWRPDEWQTKGREFDEIRDNLLGWDITDFGSGDFSKVGLLMFTIRNGNLAEKKYIKPYAEKLLIVEEGQITPYHFHWNKMEDIINRGGGDLLIQLYNSTADEQLDEKHAVLVSVDGLRRTLMPGDIIRLTPGESICLEQRCYHKFWGRGRVLVGEVSLVNDDQKDNRFYEPTGRCPEIEEDAAPLYLLCNDYARFYGRK